MSEEQSALCGFEGTKPSEICPRTYDSCIKDKLLQLTPSHVDALTIGIELLGILRGRSCNDVGFGFAG